MVDLFDLLLLVHGYTLAQHRALGPPLVTAQVGAAVGAAVVGHVQVQRGLRRMLGCFVRTRDLKYTLFEPVVQDKLTSLFLLCKVDNVHREFGKKRKVKMVK